MCVLLGAFQSKQTSTRKTFPIEQILRGCIYTVIYFDMITLLIALRDHQSAPVKNFSPVRETAAGTSTNLVARYLPATLGDELRNTLVNIGSCSNDLIL